jgi:uncharacterized protein
VAKGTMTHDLLEWIFKRRLLVLLGIVAVSLALGWQIPSLTFRTSIYELVIDDLPANLRYEEFKQVFGSDEIIRVVIKTENVFDATTFAEIESLAETATQIKGVGRVISLPGIKKALDPQGKWELGRLADVVGPVELFQRNLISDDGKTTALTLVLDDDADRDQVIGDVDDLILNAPKGISLYQIGMPLVAQALALFTEKDFLRLPPLTFALIAILLLLLYRNATCLVLPLVSVSLSLVWTFGLMALMKVPISMLLMIVPVFLLAVGTAYCLHIVSEYMERAARADSPIEAVRETFAIISPPTALAVATTIIGLGSLFVNRITAIREFAFFACFGMFALLIIVLTFFPAALSFLPLPRAAKKAPHDRPGLIDRILDTIADINLHHKKVSLPIIAVIVLFCGVGIFRLQVQTNPVGFFKGDTPVSRHFHDIYRDLSGSFPIHVSMQSRENDHFEKPENIAEIARAQAYFETLPGVDKTISFADYVKLVNYVINRFDPKFYTLPQEGFEVRMVMNNYKTILGQDMFTRFMNSDLNRANIILLTHTTSSREFLENRDRIAVHVGENFSRDLTWDVTGFGIIISESSHQLTEGQIKSLSLTMVVVFGIMFLLFLSWKAGLAAIVPNLFPIIVNFGLMGWFGVELSMATALIASVAIGLAVDDTIHYLVRFNREFRSDLDKKRALRQAISKVGRPIIFTTLTIGIGFLILTFSSFKPTAVFGVMMVVTMLAALVGDLILLPSLMLNIELITLWDLVRNRLGKEPGEGIPLFKGLTRTQMQSVLLTKPLKSFEAGTVLFHKGDPSDSMYALVSGEMDILNPLTQDAANPDYGTHKRINTLKSGDLLGEMGLLRNAPRSATAIATRPGELLQIDWKMIERLHWLYPPISQKFFRNLMNILCDRVENLTDCITDECFTSQTCGYYPRTLFLDVLKKEIERSRRLRESLCLGLFTLTADDADSLAGETLVDEILLQLDEIATPTIGSTDTLGRWDLHTMALLMPATGIDRAKSRCEHLRSSIDAKIRQISPSTTVRSKIYDLDTLQNLLEPEVADLPTA